MVHGGGAACAQYGLCMSSNYGKAPKNTKDLDSTASPWVGASATITNGVHH